MAYTTIDDPGLYFNTILYTGDASADQAQTGVGFQPDMVWTKARNATNWHGITDIARGVERFVYPNDTSAEQNDDEYLNSFDSDGFTHGENGTIGDSNNFVAWCWKTQNSAGSSNTDGSINTTTTSVGQTQGFSISTYTGTDANATIGHGLGAVPEFIIIKGRSNASEWMAYHHKMDTSVPEQKYLQFHRTIYVQDDATIWQDTAHTSTVFSIGTYTDINLSNSATYVTYCWRSIQGYSKFGGYEGNGNADGTFVYTGFKPAFVMTKSIDSTSSWEIFDNKREGYNVDNDALVSEATTVEATADQVDLLSNGFKCRIATDPNVAETYVYMAFAEAPLVNSEGVPCNAR
jgi:hypothetical protein